MRQLSIVGSFLAATFFAAVLQAQQPQLPTPEKEHEWLKQLVGEWDSEGECVMEPGKPGFKCKGTETGRLLGGFWAVVEGKSEVTGMQVNTVLTLGYDPDKKKYVGTWVDSCSNYMWRYEGEVDTSGNSLTLNTEGPNILDPTKRSKYKEKIEFKSKDHKVFTSSVLGDDGKWTTFMTANAKRKAPLGSPAAGR